MPRRPDAGARREGLGAAHPALDDGCFSCHLPHVAPAAGMLKKQQAPLCFDCHDAFPPPEPGMGGSMHQPVAQGACTRCHLPTVPRRGSCCWPRPGTGAVPEVPQGSHARARGRGLGGAAPGARRRLPRLPSAARDAAPRLLAKPQARCAPGATRTRTSTATGWRGGRRTPPCRPGCAPPATARTAAGEGAAVKRCSRSAGTATPKCTRATGRGTRPGDGPAGEREGPAPGRVSRSQERRQLRAPGAIRRTAPTISRCGTGTKRISAPAATPCTDGAAGRAGGGTCTGR